MLFWHDFIRSRWRIKEVEAYSDEELVVVKRKLDKDPDYVRISFKWNCIETAYIKAVWQVFEERKLDQRRAVC